MYKILFTTLMAAASTATFAADILTSKHKANEPVGGFAASLANKTGGGWSERFRFDTSDKGDPVIGGLTLSQSSGTQLAKLNIVNYNLKLGSDLIYPFQVIVSPSVAGSSNPINEQSSNQAKILDPESGVAIKFPVVWSYKADTGFCGFGKAKEGRCDAGWDLTINSKTLKSTDGNSQTASGATLGFGASMLLPIFDESVMLKEGYLAGAVKISYAHTNYGDTTKLFNPILDAGGNPIQFKNSLSTYEADLKFALTKQFAITARLVGPIGGNDYVTRQTSFSIDTQF